MLIAMPLLVACESSPESYDAADAESSGVTFTGPRYLRGTVGSYGTFVNINPKYVGGYGMVVDLNGTGSNEVPAFLREYLTQEMLRNNLGSPRLGTARFSPERVMADLGSSVVAVEGLIPPGARRGSKFDLLVTMIDQTSTSLAGGRLFWPTQLAPAGLDRRLIYTQTQAAGIGELFVNPIPQPGEEEAEFLRQAVVVNGGTVIESQQVRFELNQPSFRIAGLIADRINERFEAADSDNLPTAVAKTASRIDINVPQRFAGQPEELLSLATHLYLDPSVGFVRPQAAALVESLRENPGERAISVKQAWKGLGPNAVPILRPLYDDPNSVIRDAALEAGSWLGDNEAVAPLTRLAQQGTPADKAFAARSLVAMTRSSQARAVVRGMLEDSDPEVRLAAYQALVLVRDPIVRRLSVNDGVKHKFYIDRVPSNQPMVYALQSNEQSIVIFGQDVRLRKNVFAQVDESIMVRSLPVDSIPVALRDRFEGDTAFVPIHRCGPIRMIPSLVPASQNGGDAPAPDWAVEIGDAVGNTMLVNIRDPALQDAFGVELLSKPNRNQATAEPRLIATVRLVRKAGKDATGNVGPAVGELIALKSPDAQLPIALRYLKPGTSEPKIYRINPTVATFAYTLGFKRDDINTQFGPDLSFSRVVSALHSLSQQQQIPVPFYARISPLAQRIASAQRDNQAAPRPEITQDELEKLRDQENNPNTPPNSNPPVTPPADTPADSPAEGTPPAPATSAKPDR